MIRFPKVIDIPSPVNTWDEWLSVVDTGLRERGYKRYRDGDMDSDFVYCKKQADLHDIIILFYDFRPFAYRDPGANRIGVMFRYIVGNTCRIDLTVSKDITIEEFEQMCHVFYDAMRPYIEDTAIREATRMETPTDLLKIKESGNP